MQKLISLLLGACLATGLLSAAANAQDTFPNKPVRIISPFAAGGPTDALLRVLVEKLTEKWKQPVVIENKPGAGTMVGSAYVAHANPDGYTIGYVISAFATNPAVRTNVPYDMTKDFTYITQLSHLTGQPLVANPSFPANTLAEVIEIAKKSDPPLKYTSPGPGTDGHMIGQMIASKTGIKLQHIPYNGSAPALVDVLAGRVPLMFDVWISAKPHIEAGKLKVIALANRKRMPGLNYPTINETIAGVDTDSVQGFVGPAGIPKEIAEKMARDIGDAVMSPDAVERIRPLGFEPDRSTPAEFEKTMRDSLELWKKIAAEANIRIE